MSAWSDKARIIDVSHWQVPASLDWPAAIAAGAVALIAKATQGLGEEDPAFFEHSVDAYNGKIDLLGAYHFGDGSDGEAQAKHFLERLRRAYGDDLSGLMLMLDAERNNWQMEVPGAEDFVSAIQDNEKRWPWLYMGRDGPTGDKAGLPSAVLSRCPLMLPKYGPYPSRGSLPPGFRFPIDTIERAGVVRAWQFTNGVIHGGPFPGLDKVDQSLPIGVDTLDQLRALWAT